MRKRAFFTCIVLLSGMLVGVTGCVSPFYGTARIEKGWHADGGVAALVYDNVEDMNGWEAFYDGREIFYTGIRGDVELSYGIFDFWKCNLRTGIGYGFNGQYESDPYGEMRSASDETFLDAAIGTQLSVNDIFSSNVTPALRIEGGYMNNNFYVSPTLMLGIGNPEVVTIGTRVHVYPTEFFLGIHLDRWNIFTGLNPWSLSSSYPYCLPIATLGVGYKIK